jgi:hypothetical protein
VAISPQRVLRIERSEGKMPQGAELASLESARRRRNWRDAREQWGSNFLSVDAARKGAADS